MKCRIGYIDALRGFLMLLVVWGHSVQFLFANFFDTITFKTVYAFHMPAFFFISGMLLHKGNLNIGRLPYKIIRLFLPYAAWGLLIRLTGGRKGDLWFLATLSECIIVCMVSNYLFVGRFKLLGLISACVIVTALGYTQRWTPVYWGSLLAKHYRYFLAGFIGDILVTEKSTRAIGLVQTFNDRKVRMLFHVMFTAALIAIAQTQTGSIPFRILKSVVAFTGCVSLVMLFSEESYWSLQLQKVFAMPGKRTLGIYAVHMYILTVLPSVHNMNVIIFWVLLFATSLAVVCLFERIPIVNTVLLGAIPKRVVP